MPPSQELSPSPQTAVLGAASWSPAPSTGACICGSVALAPECAQWRGWTSVLSSPQLPQSWCAWLLRPMLLCWLQVKGLQFAEPWGHEPASCNLACITRTTRSCACAQLQAHSSESRCECGSFCLTSAGDSAGCVHLVSFDLQAHSGALTKLATQLVHADDITALGFAAPAASGSNQQNDAPLLAVASRRGLVKLLRVQLDGTCTLAAAMAEHTAGVTGVALLHSAGSLLVFTADRGGRRFVHKLDSGTGQLRVADHAITHRASFVGGLAKGSCGQVVVGASKGGKLHRWDLQGREIGALPALERVGRGAKRRELKGHLPHIACGQDLDPHQCGLSQA